MAGKSCDETADALDLPDDFLNKMSNEERMNRRKIQLKNGTTKNPVSCQWQLKIIQITRENKFELKRKSSSAEEPDARIFKINHGGIGASTPPECRT
jgi:hypothetical protein